MRLLPQDLSNGWTAELDFPTYDPLTADTQADIVVIGGGYTGLSACLALQTDFPNQRVVLLDGHQPGQGASARNSGYLVDSTLNDGHLSDAGLTLYASKYALARRALEHVQVRVHQHAIECDWNACGKFHAAHGDQQQAKLSAFSDTLESLGLPHQYLDQAALSARLGTTYYRHAIWTAGAVMLQPAKLALGLLGVLRSTQIYGNTPMLSYTQHGSGIRVQTPQGAVSAKRVLICTNAGLRESGQKRSFPLYLTASLTRPFDHLPEEYGILSAQAMGATVRVTNDQRIMIRNTAQVSTVDAQHHLKTHLQGLQRRFDFVQPQDIEHTWGGYTCISGNSANVFEQVSSNVWRAGCYNGGGIGLACLFGDELARCAMGSPSDVYDQIRQRPTPNWLPPQPLLAVGVGARLARDRRRAVLEK